MSNYVSINSQISSFKKKIFVPSDKSLSIRCALMAAAAIGKSRLKLLDSEDIKSTINCLRKLGIKIIKREGYYQIEGRGINGFKYKKNLVLDCGNSGTLLRLLPSLLVKSPYKIKLIGDKSLSKRNIRVKDPLSNFGAQFSKNKTPPIFIQGTDYVRPIFWKEIKGSAQIKSSVIITGALHAPGITRIVAKPSRRTTENLFKHVLKIPIKVLKKKNYDHIEVVGRKQFKSFNYNVPGDMSSAAYPLVLTLLSKKSQILIKNVNVCPTRIGIITILRKMGATKKYIKLKNLRFIKGERIADIMVKSCNSLKGINIPTKLNSFAIDEMLLLFLCSIKSKNLSYYKSISELNAKESPRLKIASKILSMMGVKNISTKNSIKIFGDPKLNLGNKKIEIKNYMKDHRIFMMAFIAANIFSGSWKIHDKDSINTSFPNFLNLMKILGAKTL